MFVLNGPLLLLATFVVTWIVLAIWLKRGRSSHWLKRSMLAVMTLLSTGFAWTITRQAVEQAHEGEAKRIELERSAGAVLLESKR